MITTIDVDVEEILYDAIRSYSTDYFTEILATVLKQDSDPEYLMKLLNKKMEE